MPQKRQETPEQHLVMLFMVENYSMNTENLLSNIYNILENYTESFFNS